MSPRHSIFALALGGVILASLGLRDWSIDGGRATAFAARALEGYGLTLTAQGPATFTALPLPRLTFTGVRIVGAAPGTPALAEDGRLTVDLDPRALISGRADISAATLDGARLCGDAAAWAGPLARLSERIGAGVGGHPGRIVLRQARLGDGSQARDIDAEVAWPFWSASAQGHASLTWRGVPARIALTRLRPAELVGGRSSPFTAEASWPDGSLALDGSARMPADGTAVPLLSGRARFETRSFPDTLAWIGRSAPLAPLAGALTLEGDFEATDRAVSWPSLRIGLGSNRLEGAGSVAFGAGDAPRLSVQATLAAETLDLTPLVVALGRLSGPEPVPMALAPLTRGDLDLRLSAASGRLGPVLVEDVAASVLVREAALEVAVNRARVHDGTVKGRVTLTSGADPAETEAKVQGGLDRIDIGALLGEIGEWRWMLGPLQGQFSLEGSAHDSAALLARVGGRAAFAVEGGSISGLDLADVIHRNGSVAPGALARRNGRTAFERASIALRFSEGVGEITEATLRGPGVAAGMQGQLSLPERRLDAQGDLALRPPADPSRGVQFEISGPWDGLTAQAFPRGEGADTAGRPAEAILPGPLKLPANLGLTGNARAYAP